jgi:folate-binding protein YgfZ
VGLDALQVLRVEAGLPWSHEDIDADVLPAETRQIERAVSFTKGCYLGQEIVERMRARGAPANLLTGLRFDGEVATGAALTRDGQSVGRVTSAVQSFKCDRRIGLGYVKSEFADSDTQLLVVDGDHESTCRTCKMPFN